jgi:hypothetical protein
LLKQEELSVAFSQKPNKKRCSISLREMQNKATLRGNFFLPIRYKI